MSRVWDLTISIPCLHADAYVTESDLEERSRKDGNLGKGLGGTRHGAYVQAIAARRESIAGRRRLDYLEQVEASRLVAGLSLSDMPR